MSRKKKVIKGTADSGVTHNMAQWPDSTIYTIHGVTPDGHPIELEVTEAVASSMVYRLQAAYGVGLEGRIIIHDGDD